MKKSLSLLLALAMVFGMFASMASAADTTLTTEQKYQWFVDNKILKGGGANVNTAVNRAEAATFAVAVGGLSEVTTSQTFSDVKKGQWWHGAIEAAAQAGLVNGIGGGKFGPKQSLTNEQYIKIAVTLAGLKPVAGAVVAGSSAWAGPYIQAAINAGLPLPANYKANATRGDVIDLSYTVYTFKAIPTLADVTAVVNADDTITVTGKVVGKADSVKVTLGTATAVAATLKDDKTFTYTTAKQVAGAYKLTVVAYDGTKASAAVEKSVTVDAFSVVSATVQNSKQIVVKFNKTVQEGNLPGGHGILTNYKLGAAGTTYPAVADLSDDKTTVTLTFNNTFANNTYSQFAVSGVKSASGITVSDYKSSINLTDTTAPSLNATTFSGTQAKLTFSEPVKTINNNTDISASVSVNGIQISLTSTPINYSFAVSNKGYVTLTLNGLESGKAYNVNLIAVEDLAVPANRADLAASLTVPTDTVAPTILSAVVTGSKLKIKFSEPLRTTTIDSVAGRYFKVAATNGVIGAVYNSNALDSNNEVTVDLSEIVGSSNSFLNTTLTISGYEDLVGNKGANATYSVVATRDTTAPQVQTVAVSGKDVIVKFDESLRASTATPGKLSYTYTSADNLRLTGSGSTGLDATWAYTYNTGTETSDSYIVLTVNGPSEVISNGALKNGTYTIDLPAATYEDKVTPTANKNAATTIKFTVNGNTSTVGGTLKLISDLAPDYGISQDQGAPNKLTFKFSEKLTQAALDASKYLIGGVQVPADSKIYFSGNYKTVIVELPNGFIPVNGIRTVKVVNIADENGATLSSTSADVQRDVNLVENVKPVAVSASLVNDKSIAVTFSETVQGSSTPSGLEIWINGVKQSTATAANGGLNPATVYYNNTNVVTISLNSSAFAAGQTIVVKFVGSDIKDLKNNTVTDAEVPVK